MALDVEAAKKWRRARLIGAVMFVGGLVLSILPLVITGMGAGVIDYLIIVGPFFVIMGLIIYSWALVGTWRTKSKD